MGRNVIVTPTPQADSPERLLDRRTAAKGQTTSGKPLVITIGEFLSCVSVGRTTCYQLINSGQLQTIKIGRRRLITMESVEQLVARSTPEVR